MNRLITVDYDKWPCFWYKEKDRVSCMDYIMNKAFHYVKTLRGDPSYFRVPYEWLDSRMYDLSYNAFTYYWLPIKFHKNIKYCMKLVYQTCNDQDINTVTIRMYT